MGRVSFFAKHGLQARVGAILSAVAAVSAASLAKADYSSVVLYPLAVPTGIDASVSAQSAAGGQTVAYGFDASGNSHALLRSAGSAVADKGPTNLTGFLSMHCLTALMVRSKSGWRTAQLLAGIFTPCSGPLSRHCLPCRH